MQRLARQTPPPDTPDGNSTSSSTTSVSSSSSSSSISSSSSSFSSSSSSSSSSLSSSVSSSSQSSSSSSSVSSLSSSSAASSSIASSIISNSTIESSSSSPLSTSSSFIPTTSAPPSLTIPPPVSSSSTTSLTTIVTAVNGTTITTAVPTSLFNSPDHGATMHRTAIIAGATAAAVVSILLALTAVFAYRRHKLRSLLALTGRKKESKALLDGEDFDDDDGVPLQHYRDTIHSSASRLTLGAPSGSSPAPSLFRPRAPDTGSIFREGVWPPPTEESKFVDPFVTGLQASSQVDLSGVVDGVMGPGHDRMASVASAGSSTSYSGLPSHNQELSGESATSATPLMTGLNSSRQTSPHDPSLPPGAMRPPLLTLTIPKPQEAAYQPNAPSPVRRNLAAEPVGANEGGLWLQRKLQTSPTRQGS